MRPRGFTPRVEALEDRRCPSVTAVQDGDTLRVTGTGNDTFTVAASGKDAFAVRSGTKLQNFGDVQHVQINLGNGVNDLTVRLDPRVVKHADIQIDGNTATTGTDNVTVNLLSGLVGRERVDIDADLGNGINNFTLGGNLGAAKSATLNGNSHLNLNYEGGSGVDTVKLNFLNINKHANADLNVGLGAGNDSFAMNLPTKGVNGDFDDRSNVDLRVDGGAGDDTATFAGRTSGGDNFHVHVANVEHGNLAQLAEDDDVSGGFDNDNEDDGDNGDNNND